MSYVKTSEKFLDGTAVPKEFSTEQLMDAKWAFTASQDLFVRYPNLAPWRVEQALVRAALQLRAADSAALQRRQSRRAVQTAEDVTTVAARPAPPTAEQLAPASITWIPPK